MKQILIAIISGIILLSVSGCTTLRESRGYLNEDIAHLIIDIQAGFSNLKEKTIFIK